MSVNPEPVQHSAGKRPVSDLLRTLDGVAAVIRRPDGTRLHAVEAGEGDDVLLVHGFGVSSDCWSLVQPRLVSAGRRVIAYDHRGHGRSSCGRDGFGSEQLRADLNAVATAYDIADATLVCHSMGNFIALGLLNDPKFRNRFRRAVLVSPITGMSRKGARAARLHTPLIRLGFTQYLAARPRTGRYLATRSLGPFASADLIEATRQSLAAIPPTVGPCITMVRQESIARRVDQIDLPMQILSGSRDRTTPKWHAELIYMRAPRAQIKFIAGAGHMMTWEAPEEIVQAVLADGASDS
ncbi:alpha/beta fold hydrolase [Nocardia sp. NPDC059240]|uniref:alpha/beta fold hydrolase n=1 Tax=Nocardia sp. NPDC059240 TaxID=3346786 RepID=UPI0036A7A036